MNEDKAREAFEAHMKGDWRGRESAAWRNPDGSYIYTESEWRAFQAALQWAASQQAAEGWKLVPVEPTREMILAALESDRVDWIGHYNLPNSIYAAMIAAAPSSTQGGAE